MGSFFDLDQIASILEMLERHDVSEFKLERGDEKLSLRRGQETVTQVVAGQPAYQPQYLAPQYQPSQQGSPAYGSGGGYNQAAHGGRCDLVWPLLAYLLFTTGELCLSPVGLSMITKLSPARLVGVFMGVWFLVSALANVISGGVIGPLTKTHGYAWVFMLIAAICGAAGVVLMFLTPMLKKNMHGMK